MRRFFNIVLPSLILMLSVVFAYVTAERTRNVVKSLAQVERQIDKKTVAIKTLRAEWANLNNPSRLRLLVKQYESDLQLIPIDAQSFGNVTDIAYPQKTSEIIEVTDEVVEEILDDLKNLDQGETNG